MADADRQKISNNLYITDMLCILNADGCLRDMIYGWAAHYIQKLNFHPRQTDFSFFLLHLLYIIYGELCYRYTIYSVFCWRVEKKIEGESRKRAKATT